MTCREFIEFLWRYIAEELQPEERAQFDTHLAACPHCGKYLQSYRDTVHASQVVFRDLKDDVSADVPEELVQAILSSRTQAS
jgi:anti-sigma factor RsiW